MDIPPNINEAAKRLREVKGKGDNVAAIIAVYKMGYGPSYAAMNDEKRMLADWLLETFPEIGR